MRLTRHFRSGPGAFQWAGPICGQGAGRRPARDAGRDPLPRYWGLRLAASTLGCILVVQAVLAPAAFAGAVQPGQAGYAGQLHLLDDAESRSISPENLSGARGGGSRTRLQDGTAKEAAAELGDGFKVNPFIVIGAGQRVVLGEADGPGFINHVWMTIGQEVTYRSLILRIYWDGEPTPSVEVPVGDFFAAAFGPERAPRIDSAMVAVNPGSGLNSFWTMPFRRKFRMELENRAAAAAKVYYQIDYTLTPLPANAAYMHAQFRMVDRLKPKDDYTILDGVRGRGRYVGTYLMHAAFSPGWWGEGEVKMYLDDDDKYPTINYTGEEDYFLGSYSYVQFDESGKPEEVEFSSLYSGFHVYNKTRTVEEYMAEGRERRIGEYRWHVVDPVRFNSRVKVTIQAIGWYTPTRYRPLDDGFSSVAFWYQTEPHAAFPALPDDRALQFKSLQGAPPAPPPASK